MKIPMPRFISTRMYQKAPKFGQKNNLSYSYSYFNGLLHEEHSNKEAKQFTSYTGEPIDDGTSTQNSQ